MKAAEFESSRAKEQLEALRAAREKRTHHQEDLTAATAKTAEMRAMRDAIASERDAFAAEVTQVKVSLLTKSITTKGMHFQVKGNT